MATSLECLDEQWQNVVMMPSLELLQINTQKIVCLKNCYLLS